MAVPNPWMSNPAALIAGAANIPPTANPAYTKDEFFEIYPMFEGMVPPAVLDMYITMATACVNQRKWQVQWPVGMSLFLAHWCTLYMESTAGCNPTATSIIAAAKNKGLQTSKAAGDVSVSYDYSTTSFDGWPQWQTTTFGAQFAALARVMAGAGMFVW